ncbi:MAG: hypothetical protein LBR88_11315 [Zoogloeaceae bacterium]|jgi:hypothetical protein|nr:hypothetical protein [Zoogloeaceae bacterium]
MFGFHFDKKAEGTEQVENMSPPAPPPQSEQESIRQHWMQSLNVQDAPETDALNTQIVQAVRLANAETAAQAPTQIAVIPNLMISQASGLLAQSAASYFDGVSKVALASKSVLLKQMTENIAQKNILQAGEDALGALVTDLLVAAAAAVAASTGAMEAKSANFAIDQINQGIKSFNTLRQQGAKD